MLFFLGIIYALDPGFPAAVLVQFVKDEQPVVSLPALNRGESYHKLRRAVSYANFRKLRFKTEYGQEIWNECARLISNCVIFYNMTLLSRLWEYRVSIGDHEGAAEILKISPVAWHHINFRGCPLHTSLTG